MGAWDIHHSVHVCTCRGCMRQEKPDCLCWKLRGCHVCLFVCLFVFASCISHVIYETGRCFCTLKSMAQVVLYLVTALHCGTLGKGWNQVRICILAAQSQFNVFYYPFTAKGEFSVPKISADTPNSVPRCSWGQNSLTKYIFFKSRSATCKKYV